MHVIVTHCKGTLDSAVHTPAMEKHLVHCHFVRIFHAHCDHCETVAYKHDLHAGCVGDMAAREIGCCKDCDGFILFVEVLNCLNCYFFACASGC